MAECCWVRSRDVCWKSCSTASLKRLPKLRPALLSHKAALAKDRERLVVPPAPDLVSGLAKHYSSKELGDLDVLADNGVTTFDIGRVEKHRGLAKK